MEDSQLQGTESRQAAAPLLFICRAYLIRKPFWRDAALKDIWVARTVKNRWRLSNRESEIEEQSSGIKWFIGSNFCLIGNSRSSLLRTMSFPPLSRFLLGRQRSKHSSDVLMPAATVPVQHGLEPSVPHWVPWGSSWQQQQVLGELLAQAWDRSYLCTCREHPKAPLAPSDTRGVHKGCANHVN